jgi:hypothetical protein
MKWNFMFTKRTPLFEEKRLHLPVINSLDDGEGIGIQEDDCFSQQIEWESKKLHTDA